MFASVLFQVGFFDNKACEWGAVQQLTLKSQNVGALLNEPTGGVMKAENMAEAKICSLLYYKGQIIIMMMIKQ